MALRKLIVKPGTSILLHNTENNCLLRLSLKTAIINQREFTVFIMEWKDVLLANKNEYEF